jgi:hypothetical protein
MVLRAVLALFMVLPFSGRMVYALTIGQGEVLQVNRAVQAKAPLAQRQRKEIERRLALAYREVCAAQSATPFQIPTPVTLHPSSLHCPLGPENLYAFMSLQL